MIAESQGSAGVVLGLKVHTHSSRTRAEARVVYRDAN
jgi:hypothetical protein